MRCAVLFVVSAVLGAPLAHAEDVIDFRGPVRVGVGFNGPYTSPMISASFEDQFRVFRISEAVGFEVLAGIDGIGISNNKLTPADGGIVGYSAAELGVGLSFRAHRGALFVTSGALGLLFDNNATSTNVAGFGFSTRVEVYPLYLSVEEAIDCKKGPAYTYVGSGLSFWTMLRGDFVEGAVAPSWAIGFGVDVARSLLLPVLGAVLRVSCSKQRLGRSHDY